MNAKFLITVALLAGSTTVHAQAAAWNVDTAHTHIGFTARHLGLAKVRGEFKKYSAVVQADAKTGKLTALSAEIETASVNTDVDKRDDDLRSDHFFSTAKFPTAKLVLKSIKWKADKFTALVTLTIRDVTKDVKFTGELLGVQTVNFGRGAHQRAAYEAQATINRQDFGLKFSGLAEGISIVSDDVEIELEAEFSMPPAAAPGPTPAVPATPTAPAAAAGSK